MKTHQIPSNPTTYAQHLFNGIHLFLCTSQQILSTVVSVCHFSLFGGCVWVRFHFVFCVFFLFSRSSFILSLYFLILLFAFNATSLPCLYNIHFLFGSCCCCCCCVYVVSVCMQRILFYGTMVKLNGTQCLWLGLSLCTVCLFAPTSLIYFLSLCLCVVGVCSKYFRARYMYLCAFIIIFRRVHNFPSEGYFV